MTPAATETRSLVLRLGEWFWASGRLRELKRQAALESGRTAVLDQRARASAELAARALDGSASALGSAAPSLACELYKQSIYWSLSSLDQRRLGSEAARTVSLESGELQRFWSTIEHAGIEPSAVPPELVAAAGSDFVKTFVDFAELSPAEQVRSAERLRRLAELLIGVCGTARNRIEAIRFQRVLRVGAVGFVMLVLLLVFSLAGAWRDEGHDLARGKHWRTSSSYSNQGCRTPDQTCPESPNYFFHTEDEDRPWLEIDLGAVEAITSARIENRLDCCTERAVPLSLEVSLDQKKYKQIARKDEPFKTWKLDFPRVSARYVRIRAQRRTLLHLSGVHVFAP